MRDLVSWIKELIDKNELWRFYKSREFMQLREEVLNEQHHECYYHRQKGQIVKGKICHHIYHVRDYPQYALSKYVVDENGEKHINLICVCHKCHETICHPDRLKKDNKNNKDIETKYPEKW